MNQIAFWDMDFFLGWSRRLLGRRIAVDKLEYLFLSVFFYIDDQFLEVISPPGTETFFHVIQIFATKVPGKDRKIFAPFFGVVIVPSHFG